MNYQQNSLFSVLFSFLIVAQPLCAQVYTPPKTQPNQRSNQNNNTTVINKREKSNSPYGNEIPFIDPTQETITIMGHTFSLSDNRLGGQFEAYLADNPNSSKEAKEYRATIKEILKWLSPHTKGSTQEKSRKAFALLPQASSYAMDAGICDSLSQAIYSAMLAKGAVQDSKTYVANLEKEKRRLTHNADIRSKKIKLKKGKKANRSQSTAEKTATSFELQEIQKRIHEIEVLKRMQNSKNKLSLFQAKIQYQALLAQLFMQRRFQHVIIGTRFYNRIFRDGDNKLHLKKGSDTAKLFSEGLGVEPTISGLDSAANEAIRKVTTLIEAFHNHIKRKELHNASKRLTEAYVIGEFLPEVQTVPAEERRKILEYVRNGHDLVNAMDIHDYTKAQIYLNKLKKQSKDFDSTKAEGAIATYIRISNFHLRAAKIALIKNDNTKFDEELKEATQIWPTNPKLKDIDNRLDQIINQGDIAKNLINDYDRLLGDKNYRGIADRYIEFAAIIEQTKDKKRKTSLKKIMSNLKEVEKAREKATFFADKGNPYAAWEILEEARLQYYDDPLLQQQITSITAEVANFTRALTRAKEFENNKLTPQTGGALSWYLEAKSIYPDSTFAKRGIDRLIERIFSAPPKQ